MSYFKQDGIDYMHVALRGREIQDICHQLAKRAGWWNNVRTGELFTHQDVWDLVPTKLMLTVSELSEAMESHRKNLMDSHLMDRHGLEVELADAVIRIMDLAGALGFDLGAAMSEKLQYNANRADHSLAARQAKGGKAY